MWNINQIHLEDLLGEGNKAVVPDMLVHVSIAKQNQEICIT